MRQCATCSIPPHQVSDSVRDSQTVGARASRANHAQEGGPTSNIKTRLKSGFAREEFLKGNFGVKVLFVCIFFCSFSFLTLKSASIIEKSVLVNFFAVQSAVESFSRMIGFNTGLNM